MTETEKRVPELRFKGFVEDWEQRKLGELLTEVKRPIKMKDDECYELVTVKRRNEGIVSRGIFRGKDVLVKSQFQIKTGDYLISKRQVVHGANGIVPSHLNNAIVSNEYLVSIGNKNITTDFLTIISRLPSMYRKFFLSSYGIDIEKLVFNVEDWKKRTIRVPGVSEQNQISIFYKQIDSTIALHQRKVTLLKRLKEAYLTRMLPQNSENIPLLRFADYFDPWEQRKFEDLAESFNYGLNASAMEFDGENKYIRITDIDEYSHRFIQSGLTSPNTDLSNANDYLLKEGDILFARTGASVGKSYQYDPLDGKVYYAGFLIRARIKPEFDSSFIFQNTLTEKYNNFIKITSQRSGQPGVNAQEYANFSIMVPSRGEQVKLGNFFKQLDNAIALHQCKIEKLAEAKKVLLAAMFV